jgi:hypothetical protein
MVRPLAAGIAASLLASTALAQPIQGPMIFDATGAPYVFVLPSGDASGATDSSNIAAAETTASAAGINEVRLAWGTFYINATIPIARSSFTLACSGAGRDGGGSVINSLVDGPAIQVETSGLGTMSWQIRDCVVSTPSSGTAALGIEIEDGQNGRLDNVRVVVNGPSQIGFYMGALAGATAPQGSSTNIINNLFVYLDPAATSATGIELNSPVAQDVYLNTFVNPVIQGSDASQTLLWLGNSDSNTFVGLSEYVAGSIGPTALTSIKFDYTINSSHPSDTLIVGINNGFDITGDSIVNVGTPSVGTAGTTANIIYGFGLTNGSNIPDLPNLLVQTYRGNTGLDATSTPCGGCVGEQYAAPFIGLGSPVSLATSGVAYNVTSETLPAGHWNIRAAIGDVMGATANVQQFEGAISTTSATLVAGSTLCVGAYNTSFVAGTPGILPLPTCHLDLSASTTVYLVALSNYTAGTVGAYGGFSAERSW